MLGDACNLLLLKYNIDLLYRTNRSDDEQAFSSLSHIYRTTQGSLKTTPKYGIYRTFYLGQTYISACVLLILYFLYRYYYIASLYIKN